MEGASPNQVEKPPKKAFHPFRVVHAVPMLDEQQQIIWQVTVGIPLVAVA